MERLVMTLLVRDEADIIEDTICFHLNSGVDFIVATDNGSQDETPDILEKYARIGLLSFTEVPEQNYQQSVWVSQMAQRTVAEFGATHMFHCDADEFWMPQSGNLKDNLPGNNQVFLVPRVNYLPPPNPDQNRKILDQFEYAVVNPLKSYTSPDDFRAKVLTHQMLFYDLVPKVFTSANYTQVGSGNHMVLTEEPVNYTDTDAVLIHHFPIRSPEQFERKIVQGALAYAINPNDTAYQGRHWKAWFEIYKHEGTLREEYARICQVDELAELIARDIVRKTTIPASIRLAKEIFESKYSSQK